MPSHLQFLQGMHSTTSQRTFLALQPRHALAARRVFFLLERAAASLAVCAEGLFIEEAASGRRDDDDDDDGELPGLSTSVCMLAVVELTLEAVKEAVPPTPMSPVTANPMENEMNHNKAALLESDT